MGSLLNLALSALSASTRNSGFASFTGRMAVALLVAGFGALLAAGGLGCAAAAPCSSQDEAAQGPAASEGREIMPLPRNRQTLLLAGIFLILLLFTLNYAGAILLPIIFAFILYLVLQPAMREATKVG